jgi:hypothetical protein
MAVDMETKRRVIELYFTQHKNIREIAKEVQKSSRDVVAVVRKHKQKLEQSQASINAENNIDQQKEESFIQPSVSVKAYDLFVKGLTPLQVAIELKPVADDADILEVYETLGADPYYRIKCNKCNLLGDGCILYRALEHMNDYHRASFNEIGSYLETLGL